MSMSPLRRAKSSSSYSSDTCLYFAQKRDRLSVLLGSAILESCSVLRISRKILDLYQIFELGHKPSCYYSLVCDVVNLGEGVFKISWWSIIFAVALCGIVAMSCRLRHQYIVTLSFTRLLKISRSYSGYAPRSVTSGCSITDVTYCSPVSPEYF